MKYFCYKCEDLRGDELNHWGHSTFWFEMDDVGYTKRQMEIYENGVALKYSLSHAVDRYGQLADQLLDTPKNNILEVSVEEFESMWSNTEAFNK